MRTKNFLMAVGLVFSLHPLAAQFREQDTRGDFLERIYFGGGGGFSGGNQFTSLSLSPLVGYKVKENFSAGMQVTYQFTKLGNFNASNYGGGPFVLYAFFDKVFAYSQFEYLNVQPLIGGGKSDRRDFTSLFAGLGYNEPVGRNLAFQVALLYNLLHGDGINSPYESPAQLRAGIVSNF